MLRTEAGQSGGGGGLVPPPRPGMDTGKRCGEGEKKNCCSVEIDLGPPVGEDNSGMIRPPQPQVSEEVFIPDGELLEEARKANSLAVKKNAYPGDWRIKVGLVVIVLATFYLFCYDILFPWIEDPHQQLWPIPDMLAVPIFYLAFGVMVMVYISYAIACCASPGTPPRNWKPTTSIEGIAPHYDPFSPNKKVRWCNFCENHKPPRTHHCKICGICVLRGDHHCMWTANCVGYRNHKAFFLFLWYLGTLIWLGIVVASIRLFNIVIFEFHRMVSEKALDDVLVLMLFFFSLMFQSYVGGMFQEQTQLIFSNVTTIEKREIGAWKKCRDNEAKEMNIKRKLVWPYQNPGGAFSNASSVFTDGWWMMPFPTMPARNPDGGTSFGYHPEFVERVLLVEEVAKQKKEGGRRKEA